MINRHCTTGKAGHVILSNNAYDQLDSRHKSAFKYEKAPMFMKGKGNVDTFSINLYGSQRNIKKPIPASETNKFMNSAKSNNSMNLSGRLESSNKNLLRQGSVISYKQKIVNEIKGNDSKGKVQEVGKGLWHHIKKQMENLVPKSPKVADPKNKHFSFGNPLNFTNLAGSAEQLSSKNDLANLPIQNLLKDLQNNQKLPTEGLNSLEKEEGLLKTPINQRKEEYMEKSASFEDVKSIDSEGSLSFEGPAIKTKVGNMKSSLQQGHTLLRKSFLDKDKIKNMEDNYNVSLFQTGASRR